jgi:DNA-binding NarL/FixJ family response regulator
VSPWHSYEMTVTVLVVDDDAAFRHLATRLLRSWGYQVVGEAASLAEALARAAELSPDAALVDVALPDGNGFDLTVSLRSLPSPARVVLISSDAEPGFTTAAHRAGADGFLAKDQLAAAALRRLIEAS